MLRQLGVWCSFNILWILCLVPLFWGDGEISPNFAKNLTVSSFGKSMQVSLYPFLRNHSRRVAVNERTTAYYEVSCNSSSLVPNDSVCGIQSLDPLRPAVSSDSWRQGFLSIISSFLNIWYISFLLYYNLCPHAQAYPRGLNLSTAFVRLHLNWISAINAFYFQLLFVILLLQFHTVDYTSAF